MSLITYLTRIHFADRVLEDALGEEIIKLGLRRPAIICDGAAGSADALERALDALPASVRPLPTRYLRSRFTEATYGCEMAAWIEAGCDGTIGIGGPAALDLARALGRGGPAGARAAAATPVIAIPTTTASIGLGPIAPVLGAGADARLPALILCDPTLTLAAGPVETAAAGMHALVHCLEAWLAGAWNPPADGIALDGLRRAGRWLPRAVADGSDPAARREMLAAALCAGLAAEKGLGAVCALAHAVEDEARPGAGYGMLHAALVAPVLAFNAPAVSDRLDAVRDALGLDGAIEPGPALAKLGSDLGLPDRLGGVGLDEAALRRSAIRASEDPATLTNPRHATAADYMRILEAAL